MEKLTVSSLSFPRIPERPLRVGSCLGPGLHSNAINPQWSLSHFLSRFLSPISSPLTGTGGRHLNVIRPLDLRDRVPSQPTHNGLKYTGFLCRFQFCPFLDLIDPLRPRPVINRSFPLEWRPLRPLSSFSGFSLPQLCSGSSSCTSLPPCCFIIQLVSLCNAR